MENVCFQLCMDSDLYVIDNPKYDNKHFCGNVTYRKKENWISKLDLVLVSMDVLQNIGVVCCSSEQLFAI